jgi:hypothetical protein
MGLKPCAKITLAKSLDNIIGYGSVLHPDYTLPCSTDKIGVRAKIVHQLLIIPTWPSSRHVEKVLYCVLRLISL